MPEEGLGSVSVISKQFVCFPEKFSLLSFSSQADF
jgi:hypothetical protein